jgi:hypothetical protein
MATKTPFGAAEVSSGANKGKPRTISFATGIAVENANGLPIKDGKVMVEMSAATPQVWEFASADEVRAAAGAHLDSFLLDAANAKAKSDVRSGLTTEFRKLSLAPSDIPAFVASICDKYTPESVFTPAERGTSGPRGIKAELAGLQAAAENLSKADLLAAIAKLLG